MLLFNLHFSSCQQHHLAGVEQQQQSELATAAQQSEARVSEVECELVSKVKALSHLLDHTAKAGSQVMAHVAHLESTTKSHIAGDSKFCPPKCSLRIGCCCLRTGSVSQVSCCWRVCFVHGILDCLCIEKAPHPLQSANVLSNGTMHVSSV